VSAFFWCFLNVVSPRPCVQPEHRGDCIPHDQGPLWPARQFCHLEVAPLGRHRPPAGAVLIDFGASRVRFRREPFRLRLVSIGVCPSTTQPTELLFFSPSEWFRRHCRRLPSSSVSSQRWRNVTPTKIRHRRGTLLWAPANVGAGVPCLVCCAAAASSATDYSVAHFCGWAMNSPLVSSPPGICGA